MDKSTEQLRKRIDRTNKLLYRFVSIKQTFIRGLIYGFGAFLGATILITIFVGILTKLSVVPVIGDIATQVVKIVKENTNEEQESPSYIYPHR